MKDFFVLDEESIKNGSATDLYFKRTEEILEQKEKNPKVVAEVTASREGIFSGLKEVLNLFRGKDLDIFAMPEGSFFRSKQPVLWIEANYLEFCRYETPLLGSLCHASGIASKAAQIKQAAKDKNVLSFGTRRQHPSISPLIERSAYLGGMDGVSNQAAAQKIGIEASGTMPHSLIVCFGDQEEAWRAYDDVVSEDVPRIMLCDTYSDEKEETLRVAEELGEALDAVRLDTPGSRRGNFREIIEEVRWELDIRGYQDVEIFISGNIDVEEILEYRDLVDGFGVGTSVSSADPIDFGLDIVEVEGEFSAKKGKLGGKKQVYRSEAGDDEVKLFNDSAPEKKEPLLKKYMENGEIIRETDLESARKRAKRVIKRFDLNKTKKEA
ncbi:nicotinate phosphoribosyltransferase [archaeon SCG-AAA382B04]|nr:nicotinate phosphoribosyltransferase [archaeon SCG-AAA382B04]